MTYEVMKDKLFSKGMIHSQVDDMDAYVFHSLKISSFC